MVRTNTSWNTISVDDFDCACCVFEKSTENYAWKHLAIVRYIVRPVGMSILYDAQFLSRKFPVLLDEVQLVA